LHAATPSDRYGLSLSATCRTDKDYYVNLQQNVTSNFQVAGNLLKVHESETGSFSAFTHTNTITQPNTIPASLNIAGAQVMI